MCQVFMSSVGSTPVESQKEIQGSTNSVKHQTVETSGFEGHVVSDITQLSCCRMKAMTDNMDTNKRGCVIYKTTGRLDLACGCSVSNPQLSQESQLVQYIRKAKLVQGIRKRTKFGSRCGFQNQPLYIIRTGSRLCKTTQEILHGLVC